MLILNSERDVQQVYYFVTILRCLWLRGKNPAQWSAVKKLVSNVQYRRGTKVYNFNHNDYHELGEGHRVCVGPSPELIGVIKCVLHARKTLHNLISESNVKDNCTGLQVEFLVSGC